MGAQKYPIQENRNISAFNFLFNTGSASNENESDGIENVQWRRF